MKPIYLDHNATTPPAPQAIAAMVDCQNHAWGNCSSKHAVGQVAKQRLAAARATLAKFLDCKPANIVFTSGATEANHVAVHALLALSSNRRLLVSAVEHAAFQKLVRALPDVRLQIVPVRPQGDIDLDALYALLREGPGAVLSVMAANNETGVLMPVTQIAALAHEHGALFHVDATQWIGKLPFSFTGSDADLASLSAHKLHGPKGIGALLVRPGLNVAALTPGSQERGRRGGTENLPAIAGFAAAAESLLEAPGLSARAERLSELRDRLEQGLVQRLPGTVVFGRSCERLPNTCYLRFGRLDADLVLNRLERIGVMASSGSACSSGGNEPSHVLLAMGIAREDALCAIRLSLAHTTTEAEIDAALDGIPAVLGELLEQAQTLHSESMAG